MTKVFVIIALMIAVGSGGAEQVLAQSGSSKDRAEKNKPVEPALPALIAPYDEQLLRLSEVLGAIHFLRDLCQANEGPLWRDKMAKLIDAEEPRPARKSRMIARFNRGYGAYNSTYRTCTTAALVAVKRYMKEGVRLSSQITTRYGR